jgi:isopenicillin N synthase-like dioxygenase
VIGAEVPASDPLAGSFQHGPNQWPKALAAENFEIPLQEYRGRMVKLAESVLRILALALPENQRNPHVFDEFMIKPSGNLRLLHYPPQLSEDERQLGGM